MNRQLFIKFGLVALLASTILIAAAIYAGLPLAGSEGGAGRALYILGVSLVFGLILCGALMVLMRVVLRVGMIERGAAQELTSVMADSALGDLSRTWEDVSISVAGEIRNIPLAEVYERLTMVMAETDRMSNQLNRLSQDLLNQAAMLAEGAEDQSSSVKESAAAVGRIETSTKEILTNVGDLGDLGDNVSASTYELMASIDEVNRTVQALNQSVREVVSAIQQITGNMHSVGESADGLSAAASQSQASVREIDRATRTIRDRADSAAGLAEAAREGAGNSKKLLAGAVSKVRELQETVDGTRAVMQQLGVQSRSIGEILTVISSVTADTHLLSLNASIMAAKAGEHGRGFAVVAQEIKTLALRTSQSAKEIESLILETQDSVDRAIHSIEEGAERARESMRISEEADLAMADVVKRAEVAADNARKIAQDTDAQAEMTESVAKAVEEVAKRTGLIRSSMRDQEDSIQFVQKQSLNMKDNMDGVALAMNEQAQASSRISKSLETLTSRIQGIRSAAEEHVRSAAGIVHAIHTIRKKADLVTISAQNVNNTSMSVLNHSHLIQHDLRGIQLPERANRITIGLLMDNVREERWRRERELFSQRGESLGVNLIIKVAEGNPRRQLEQAREILAGGINLLIVVAVDAEAASTIVDEANAASIPVVIYDRLVMNCKPDLFVSFDAPRIGEMQAQAALDAAKGKRIMILAGSPKDQNAQMLYRGQMKVLKPRIERGEAEIVAESWTPDWDPQQAYLLTRQVIENKGAIDAIIAANDGTASGAIKAVQDALKDHPVVVTGMDTELSACRRIVEGSQLMTVYMPIKLQGARALEAALLMLKGEEIPGITDYIDNGRAKVPSILLKPIKIDRDNLEEVVVKDGFHSRADIFL